MGIENRKADHIRICLEEDVSGRGITTGFERYRFVHQALPEIDLRDVDTSMTLWGRQIRVPLLISSMTGGAPQAQEINRNLAIAAQELGLAMGVGSQRAALQNPELAPTYQVRAYAPDSPLFANVGAVQLNYSYGVRECRQAVDMIEADGLILHLNALQEAVQPEGDTNFAGLAGKIATVCREVGVPVIVKEVGWGISGDVAWLLREAGVSAIDVAGAGGTSWSQVEAHRIPTEHGRLVAEAFADWGIPTVASLRSILEAGAMSDRHLFASGGIRNGIDVAKAIALGADLAGIARPFLKAAAISAETAIELGAVLRDQLRIAMFSVGAGTLGALRRTPHIIEVK
ncbi:MAG TPA: type 2 isopentenyl-diphosphate Delta-isomerase [Chloroflexia bacterium]|nr:type 2 isopentenyl-diphosphate Delta-isomerase [Chloroflexia bacterium]